MRRGRTLSVYILLIKNIMKIKKEKKSFNDYRKERTGDIRAVEDNVRRIAKKYGFGRKIDGEEMSAITKALVRKKELDKNGEFLMSILSLAISLERSQEMSGVEKIDVPTYATIILAMLCKLESDGWITIHDKNKPNL